MKIVISLLSLIIFMILVGVYVKISTPEYVEPVKTYKQETKKEEIVDSFKIERHFEFPARIAFMNIDLKKRSFKYIEMYKLILKVYDRYTLFNLKQFLKAQGVPFSLIEDRGGVKIYILFKSLAQADRVINLFKEYNFKIKLQKLKQRI